MALAAFLFAPALSRADDPLAITITPPFFELNVSPGDTWSSYIEVINSNKTDLAIYANPMGFAAADDEGHGTFIDPKSVAGDTDALVNWIVVPGGPYLVPPGQEEQIPFTINVPRAASPGGHYAAILLGTMPPKLSSSTESQVGVGSFISSLIFVRVNGNVNEAGSIQDFSTDKAIYETPDAKFSMEFRNDGDVHLRPVGQIEVYDMWGKEQGKIDVNTVGDLGYVLPSSSRKFAFTWNGAPGFFDVGQYRAVLSLSYGEDGKKSISREIVFWVIPVWPLLGILGGALLVIFLVVIAIKKYVQHATEREISRYGIVFPTKEGPASRRSSLPEPPAGPPASHAAREDGVIDLRRPPFKDDE